MAGSMVTASRLDLTWTRPLLVRSESILSGVCCFPRRCRPEAIAAAIKRRPINAVPRGCATLSWSPRYESVWHRQCARCDSSPHRRSFWSTGRGTGTGRGCWGPPKRSPVQVGNGNGKSALQVSNCEVAFFMHRMNLETFEKTHRHGTGEPPLAQTVCVPALVDPTWERCWDGGGQAGNSRGL
jgi:hypothetical protein